MEFVVSGMKQNFLQWVLFDREKARVLLPVHSFGAFLIFAITSGKSELTEVKGILDNNVQGRSILIVFGICTSIGSLSTPPLCLLPYICRWPSEENRLWYRMRRVEWACCAFSGCLRIFLNRVLKYGTLKAQLLTLSMGGMLKSLSRCRKTF